MWVSLLRASIFGIWGLYFIWSESKIKSFIFSNRNSPFDIVPKDPYYDSARARFHNRSRIRNFGCKYLPIIADFIESNPNGEKMNIEEELMVLSAFHSGKLQFRRFL